MTLDEIYRKARKFKLAFDADIGRLAKNHGATPILAALKDESRAKQKIARLYKGDADKITDVLRATLLVGSADQVAALFDGIMAKYQGAVFDCRNNYNGPHHSSDGYFDAKIDVYYDGVKAEIQIHTRAMFDAKERAHSLYEQRQRLLQGDELTAGQRQAVKDINKKMRDIFREAWS